MVYHILVFVDYMVGLSIICALDSLHQLSLPKLKFSGWHNRHMHMMVCQVRCLLIRLNNLHCYRSRKSGQKCRQWHNVPCAFEQRLVWLSCHDRRDKI